MSKKSLIIYFSLSGKTQQAAMQLQQKTAADLYQLQPAEPYSTNYDDIVARGEKKRIRRLCRRFPVNCLTSPNTIAFTWGIQIGGIGRR